MVVEPPDSLDVVVGDPGVGNPAVGERVVDKHDAVRPDHGHDQVPVLDVARLVCVDESEVEDSAIGQLP